MGLKGVFEQFTSPCFVLVKVPSRYDFPLSFV